MNAGERHVHDRLVDHHVDVVEAVLQDRDPDRDGKGDQRQGAEDLPPEARAGDQGGRDEDDQHQERRVDEPAQLQPSLSRRSPQSSEQVPDRPQEHGQHHDVPRDDHRRARTRGEPERDRVGHRESVEVRFEHAPDRRDRHRDDARQHRDAASRPDGAALGEQEEQEHRGHRDERQPQRVACQAEPRGAGDRPRVRHEPVRLEGTREVEERVRESVRAEEPSDPVVGAPHRDQGPDHGERKQHEPEPRRRGNAERDVRSERCPARRRRSPPSRRSTARRTRTEIAHEPQARIAAVRRVTASPRICARSRRRTHRERAGDRRAVAGRGPDPSVPPSAASRSAMPCRPVP